MSEVGLRAKSWTTTLILGRNCGFCAKFTGKICRFFRWIVVFERKMRILRVESGHVVK